MASRSRRTSSPVCLGGVSVLTAEGQGETAPVQPGALYDSAPPHTSATTLKAMPYSTWDNREGGEMQVWLRRA